MSIILDSFIRVAPFINDLTMDDVGVTVADTEKYLTFVKGNQIPQLVNEGDPILQGTVVGECIKTGKKFMKKVSAEVAGFPYVAFGLPIIENNNIVGAVSFLTSIDKQDKLLTLAEDLSSELEELTQSSQQIDSGAEKLSDISKKLSEKSSESNSHIDESDGILRFINDIAKQTNLLGLNAAIEAARVGQEGKGFGVVAEEIRKLAQNSSESIKQIEDILKGIKDTSSSQGDMINEFNSIIKNQSEAISAINSSIQQLYAAINILVEEAKNLTS